MPNISVHVSHNARFVCQKCIEAVVVLVDEGLSSDMDRVTPVLAVDFFELLARQVLHVGSDDTFDAHGAPNRAVYEINCIDVVVHFN